MRSIDVLRRSRPEDLLLLAWVALGWPAAVLLTGDPDRGLADAFDPDEPVRGLIWTAAAIGALVVLATQDRDREPDRRPLDERFVLYGPLFGAMLLVAGGASTALGLGDSPGLAAAFIAMIAISVLAGFGRFGRLERPRRAALMTPFILVTTGIFIGTMADVGLGPELLRLLTEDPGLGTAGPGDPGSALGGIAVSALILFVAGAIFYPMLVIAPRTLVDGRVDARTWLVRFVAFVVASMAGLTWLTAVAA